jgi:hypothetical protein
MPLLVLPLMGVVIATAVWRLHLRALRLLGPSLADHAGIPGVLGMAQVVSVLVDGDSVLIGLRSAHPAGPTRTILLSIDGHDFAPAARLQRWQASGTALLHSHDAADGTVELRELHTGQHIRLHEIGPEPFLGNVALAPRTRGPQHQPREF